MKSLKEAGKCSLCGLPYEHFGNNPEPLGKFHERCCDVCNSTKVLPARFARFDAGKDPRHD